MARTRRKPANKAIDLNQSPGRRFLKATGQLATLGLLLGFSPMGLSPAKAQADAPRSLDSTEPKPAPEGEGKTSAPQDEVAALKQKIAELERLNDQLTQSMTVANAEAEFFRKQYQTLRLQNEALGVNALTADEKALRERLVRAVGEGYQREMQRRQAVNLLGKLLVAARQVISKAESVDPERRSNFEVAARETEGYLAGKTVGNVKVGSSLQDGQVVDVNDEISIVILNIGREQGVQPGMPFSVMRKGVIVGKVKVFRVDEQFSTALIESREHLEKNDQKPLVGDQVKVQTNR